MDFTIWGVINFLIDIIKKLPKGVKLLLGGILIGLIIYNIYLDVSKEEPVSPLEPRLLYTPVDVSTFFFPSGWMGDGEYDKRYIGLNTAFRDEIRPDGVCVMISYQPGPKGWAGIYWQYPDSNWGGQPGSKIVNATKITFWARGETGSEIVEFKAGGIRDLKKPYRDSFEISRGSSTLSKKWERYEIDIARQNLSHVIGAFAWVATRDANPQGLIFYLDDIKYE